MVGLRAEPVSFSDMIPVYSPPILLNVVLICTLDSGGPINFASRSGVSVQLQVVGWLWCLLWWIGDEGYLAICLWSLVGRSLLIRDREPTL